jgi:ACS family hexuronate transporter-like MFS transporter
MHAFVKTTFGFGVVRAFLGVTEAGNFPAAIKVVAEWFPKRERAFATGIFNSGTNIGAIIAPLVVPWLAITYGWQMAFIVTGAVGFLWLIFWFLLYETPERHKRISASELAHIQSDEEIVIPVEGETEAVIPWRQLLTYKQTWAYAVGKFLSDGVWWFFLFWLPAFLISEYKLVGLEVSVPVAVVYLIAGIGSIAGGWLPMWFTKNKGWTMVRSRKTSMLIYAVIPLMVMFSQWAGSFNMWYAVIIIGIGMSAHQAWSANIMTTVSDMFPKTSIGAVIGIGGMFGGFGNITVAKSAGYLLDHYKAAGHIQTGYYMLFLFCGTAYLLAWFLMFRVLVPKMTPIKPHMKKIE